MKGRIEEASNILAKIAPEGTDIDELVHDIKRHVHEEGKAAQQGWTPILQPNRAVKLMLLAGIGIGVAQQITGIDSFIFYFPRILQGAGLHSHEQIFAYTVAIGVVKSSATMVAILFSDSFGR